MQETENQEKAASVRESLNEEADDSLVTARDIFAAMADKSCVLLDNATMFMDSVTAAIDRAIVLVTKLEKHPDLLEDLRVALREGKCKVGELRRECCCNKEQH